MDENRSYVAYMLRLWHVEQDDGPAWRASLESPQTTEYRVFTSLDALFQFLLDTTGELTRAEHLTQLTQRERAGDHALSIVSSRKPPE